MTPPIVPPIMKSQIIRPPQDVEPISVHMMHTYRSLRRLLVVVTTVFLGTLLAYRASGQDHDGQVSVVRNSISAYYHHDNRDVPIGDLFVGALSAAGLLLITYQGYRDRESLALTIAGC